MEKRIETPDKIEMEANPRKTGKVLDEFAEKGEFGPIYERPKLVDACIKYLANHKSVMLVGEHGVGKNAVVESIALRIFHKKIKDFPWKHIVETNSMLLQTGCYYASNLENKIYNFIQNCIDEKMIIFLDNIHLGIGGGSSLNDLQGDVINIIHSFLGSVGSDISLIGATTPEGLKTLERIRPDFANRFEKIEILPTTPDETLKILKQIRDKEFFRPVDDKVLEGIIRQSERFFHWKVFPGKAFELLFNLNDSKQDFRPLTEGDLNFYIMNRTGLPNFIIYENIPVKKADIKKYFLSEIFGQDEAVDTVVNAILRFKVWLNESEKPVASFLFAGPSGIGKTEIAKVLARYLFGSEDKLFIYPMSQFSGEAGFIKLMGSPGLYGVDMFESGKLLNDVRTTPFSVVLLDEIDMASPSVRFALYQILDEGKFTETIGRETFFKNTIIIMTTNVGMDRFFAKKVDISTKDDEKMKKEHIKSGVIKDLEYNFGKAFLNRIMKVVIFNTLDKDIIKKIALKTIDKFTKILPGLSERGLKIEVSDEVLRLLTEKGYNEKYGARRMENTVRDYCINPIAAYISEQKIVNAGTLLLDLDKAGKVVVSKKKN